jgi:ABC-type maltose transport system permease subunit
MMVVVLVLVTAGVLDWIVVVVLWLFITPLTYTLMPTIMITETMLTIAIVLILALDGGAVGVLIGLREMGAVLSAVG